MSQVAMIGGIFLYADDPTALAKWYADQFELEFQDWGNCKGLHFSYLEADGKTKSMLVFSIHTAKGPLPKDRGQCVINYRVHNLDATTKRLTDNGVKIAENEDGDYGRFAWVYDPEGNRIELWEAPASTP